MTEEHSITELNKRLSALRKRFKSVIVNSYTDMSTRGLLAWDLSNYMRMVAVDGGYILKDNNFDLKDIFLRDIHYSNVFLTTAGNEGLPDYKLYVSAFSLNNVMADFDILVQYNLSRISNDNIESIYNDYSKIEVKFKKILKNSNIDNSYKDSFLWACSELINDRIKPIGSSIGISNTVSISMDL